MPDLNVMFQSQQAILQKGGPIFKQAHKLCIATRAFEALVLGSIKKRVDSSVAARTPIIFLTYIVAFGIFAKPMK